jgi:hypothetical protein
MIFSCRPSVHFKHLLIVCGARGVTKRCHRNNGLFSERISFYPLLFLCKCHGAARRWAPNLSLCSGHVECCFDLFFASVSCSLDTFILVLDKVMLCVGLFRYKICFLYFGCQLLNPNMHKWLENRGSIPRSIIFCQLCIDRRLWTSQKFWPPSQLVPCLNLSLVLLHMVFQRRSANLSYSAQNNIFFPWGFCLPYVVLLLLLLKNYCFTINFYIDLIKDFMV